MQQKFALIFKALANMPIPGLQTKGHPAKDDPKTFFLKYQIQTPKIA